MGAGVEAGRRLLVARIIEQIIVEALIPALGYVSVPNKLAIHFSGNSGEHALIPLDDLVKGLPLILG